MIPKISVYLKNFRNNHPHLVATLAFVLATLILTWPLALHLTTSYPSTFYNFGGDPNMYISYMDLTAKKISGELPVDLNRMIFYPDGVNLAAGYEGPIMLVVSVPIVLLTNNPILAYNIVLILAFVLTCLACYHLVNYLTKSFYASVLSGFAFGLSPFMLARGLQHIDLLFLFCVPFMALATLQFLDRPSYKNILILALAFLVASFSAWYYLVGGIIFITLAFLFNYREFFQAKKLYFIAFVAVCLSVLGPASLIIANRSESTIKIVDDSVDRLGARPLGFILPHPFAVFWHELTDDEYKKFPSVYDEPYPYFEQTSYFGIVGLLAIMTLVFWHRKVQFPGRAFWIVVLVFFALLALGKFIWVNGVQVQLPFAFLHKIFPFSHMRAPNRFFVYAFLSATVIFGYFLARVRQAVSYKKYLVLFTVSLIFVLLTERWMYPYQLVDLPVSEFYKSIGKDEADYAVVDLPIAFPGESSYNYFQVYHKKPIVDGEFFWTTYSNQTFDFIKNNSLLNNMAYCYADLTDLNPDQALAQLARHNIRYVIIHNFILHDHTKCPDLQTYARKFFEGRKPVFTDGEITVYATGP